MRDMSQEKSVKEFAVDGCISLFLLGSDEDACEVNRLSY